LKGTQVEISAQHVWLMLSSAMVLFMTPGLGLFYGGMTRAKAALNMIMMSFISAGIVGVVWVLWGYSMTTGDGFLGLFGNPLAHFGLQDLIGSPDLILGTVRPDLGHRGLLPAGLHGLGWRSHECRRRPH
jgi:Amt family ammonium transporter